MWCALRAEIGAGAEDRGCKKKKSEAVRNEIEPRERFRRVCARGRGAERSCCASLSPCCARLRTSSSSSQSGASVRWMRRGAGVLVGLRALDIDFLTSPLLSAPVGLAALISPFVSSHHHADSLSFVRVSISLSLSRMLLFSLGCVLFF